MQKYEKKTINILIFTPFGLPHIYSQWNFWCEILSKIKWKIDNKTNKSESVFYYESKNPLFGFHWTFLNRKNLHYFDIYHFIRFCHDNNATRWIILLTTSSAHHLKYHRFWHFNCLTIHIFLLKYWNKLF